jgi:L-lysine epsilon oxidase-like protein
MPVRYAVHPAIGVARVGDSPEDYFIGPEAPGVPPAPVRADEPPREEATYKDEQHRIKRQGARFRVYQYTHDEAGAVRAVREITAGEARIDWEVHLVNRKAAAPKFGGEGRRNAGVPESRLVIDAGPQTIGGPAQGMKRLQGSFQGSADTPVPVPLGDLLTDSAGRLIVLGGFGHSQSVGAHPPLREFANNDDWCDDVADGPVRAIVRLNDGSPPILADSAWVIVAPPDFAPALENVVTLYDVVYARMAQRDPALAVSETTEVSFTRDVYPVLRRASSLHWVSGVAARGHAPGRRGHFLSQIDELSTSGPESAVARGRIFRRLRNPQGGGGNMPLLPASLEPGDTVALSEEQFQRMKKWAAGEFLADWPGEEPAPPSFDEVPAAERPKALDRAALEACVGGGFFPGIEVGRVLLEPDTFDRDRPFRVDARLLPGALTARMAVPWQADFHDCDFEDDLGMDWWPGQRPTQVFRAGSQVQSPWMPRDWSREKMVTHWATLGFVVPDGPRFVEHERS